MVRFCLITESYCITKYKLEVSNSGIVEHNYWILLIEKKDRDILLSVILQIVFSTNIKTVFKWVVHHLFVLNEACQYKIPYLELTKSYYVNNSSAKMSKWFISLVAFLVYMGIAQWIYLCPISQAICPTETEEVAAEVPDPAPVEEIQLEPIMFNWNNPEAVTTARYDEAYRQRILADNKEGKILEITGFYHPNEENTTSFDDLGFARARTIANLFPEIPKERIEELTQRVDNPDSDPGNLMSFSQLKWVDEATEDAPEEAARVVDIADRQVAYFPFSSANPILPQELRDYLKNLAENLKASGGDVRLVGHTDNVGDAAMNKQLGQSRANSIRDELIKNGVEATKITTSSMGETEPTASNDTDRGRARNRRVEIIYQQ
jgi:OOP family OmpA-OmpF porin